MFNFFQPFLEENKNCAPAGKRSIDCGVKWKGAMKSCCPGLVCGDKKRCVPTSVDK